MPTCLSWQVMDPDKATAKARKQAAPGKVLLSFFGDNSWGWFTQDALLPFAQHYEDKHKQQGVQSKVDHGISRSIRF